MILCLDIGNTHIFGGVYLDNQLQLQFRYPSGIPCTSDQLGIFLKSVLRENTIEAKQISQVSICSVVPSLNYSARAAFLKYFELDPIFLDVDQSHGLNIHYKNIHEIGADRISSTIAAIAKYPEHNIIVIDWGTATTFDAIRKDKTYLGGVIIPGIYISMKSLSENTAKLSTVNIVKPQDILGHSTAENIQSGLYYSHLGAAKEILSRIRQDVFNHEAVIVLGTGGFAYLFEDEAIFDVLIPELVLDGLNHFVQQQNSPSG